MAIRLTKKQRRTFKATAAEMNSTVHGDKMFFASNKNRSYRLRLASQAEVERHEVVVDKTISVPENYGWLFVLVRQLEPGVRIRTFIRGSAEMARVDIGEAAASKLWEITAKHRTSLAKIQTDICAILRSRNCNMNSRSGR